MIIRIVVLAVLRPFALALLLAACTGGKPMPAGQPHGQPSDGTIALAVRDNSFRPKTLTVPAGQPVVITMRNIGVAPHTFTARDFSIDVSVDAGRTGTIAFTPTSPGTFEFVCKLHRPDMTGRLIVT